MVKLDDQIKELGLRLGRSPAQVREDLSVVDRIQGDLPWAIDTFFVKGRGWLYEPMASFQRDGVLRALEDSPATLEVWPRGHCKTTLFTRALTALRAATGQFRYVVIFSATKENAEGNQEAFETIYKSGLFSDLRYYLAYWNGPQIAEFAAGECVLGNGTIIEFRSFAGEARGLNRGGRPDYIVLDDVLPTDAAESRAIREDVTNRFFSMIRPLGEAGSRVHFVGTVMHRDDIIWKIATNKIPGYRSVVLSAIDEDNQKVLWDSRYSYHDLAKIKDEYAAAGRLHLFRREYMSDPAEDETHPLSRYEWGRYEFVPANTNDIVAIDHAHGTGRDKFVIAQVSTDEKGITYIPRLRWSVNWEIDQRLAECLAFIIDAKPKKIIIQRTVESMTFIEVLEKHLRSNGISAPIETPSANQGGEKKARIYSFLQPAAESGTLLLPQGASWTEDFLRECRNFDMNARDNEDDIIDTVSLGVRYSRHASPIPKPKTSGNDLIDRIRKDMMYPNNGRRFNNRARPKWIRG